ncbi:pectate lyase-like adhesive domain-containing protein [Gemmiger formicilis]|uniref:pectate lyase-like adhesive domain-containing protein n=1 Tax=Gemmiger formicilis TaxID=745368 RepID=UPI003079FB2A
MKKRIVSTLLALCMLLCLMPTAAFAEESTETPPVCSCETACTAESMNTECPVCGVEGALPENCAKCAQPKGEVSDPQPEKEVSDPQLETALTALIGGNETAKEVSNESELTAAIADTNVNTVKLAANIDISSSLTVNRAVTLDLNGYVLKYESANKGSVIVVENGGQLTIEDSNTSNLSHKFMPNGKLWVLDDASGTEAVTGGVITGGTGTDISTFGGTTWYCGGGALIKNGGSLTMRGGNIIGCSAECGGGVCIDSEQGQFSMSGGSIAGCVASDIGGGVFASGTFKMSGPAVIRSCTAESATQYVCGGGVYVNVSSSFEMSDTAIIEGCQAISTSSNSSNGGGVYVSSSSSFVMSNEAKIEGCQAISNSSNSSNGGGVHLANNTKFTLSGNAVIQNCTATNSANSGEAYGGGVSAACVKEITLADSARIVGCAAANGSGLYITGSQVPGYGKLFANGGSVDGDVVLGDTEDGPSTITGSGGTVFNGKVTVTPGSTIESGKFNGEVINNGTITGGVFNNTVSGNGTITGGTFNTPMTGSGTESDPYQISTAAQLKRFRDIVNGSNGQTPNHGACAVLTNDIVLNDGTFAEDGSYTPGPSGKTAEEWTPIGKYTNDNDNTPYTGTFDGQGHTIKGLYVNSASDTCVGLFGYLEGAAVRNLTVDGYVQGRNAAGGIVGYASNAAIENCSNHCSVTGSSTSKIGGIAGLNVDGAKIIDCYNVGTIRNSNVFEACGGIVWGNAGTVSNCYNVGTISGNVYDGEIVGNNTGTVENCYYLAGTNLNAVGQSDSNGNITKTESKTAAEFADGTVLALLKADRDNSPWDSCQYVAAAKMILPVFKGQGDAHDHTWSAWTSNGDGTHSRRCTCNAVETVNCSGGKATCKDKAICEICGDSYGSPDPNNHAHLKHIDAKAATVAEEGNIAYWYCGDCNKYFSDAAATKEITKAATVTAKLPPKITAGDGAAVTQGEKKELTFTSDASFADFLRVELDGTALEEKNYTKREGSTIITLNRDFVATLSVGDHTLAIVSKSGTATAKFTVKAKPAETATTQPTVTPQPTAQPQPTVQPVSPIPRTGDAANPALWFALLIVSGSALAAIFVLRRKANRK